MAVLRHRCERDFTVIPNAVFKCGLSLKGIGLLCLLLSLPENWNFSTAGLCAICSSDGRDSICKGLKELEAARYLVRFKKRTAAGKADGVEWVVSDFPIPENPKPEIPESGNPLQSNTYSIKNVGNKRHNRVGQAPTRSRFTPPSVEEVQAYCAERRNDVDAQRFVDYYSASGWKRGKTPIKDWKACVRTWERGESSKHQNNVPDYTAYQEESL